MIDTAFNTRAIHFPIAEIFFEIIEFPTPQDSTSEILAADGLSSVDDEDTITLYALFEQLEGGRSASETRVTIWSATTCDSRSAAARSAAIVA